MTFRLVSGHSGGKTALKGPPHVTVGGNDEAGQRHVG